MHLLLPKRQDHITHCPVQVIYYEEHASAMYLEEEAYGGNVY